MRTCFERLRQRINDESVVDRIKNASIDSSIHYLAIINGAVEAESASDSLCSKAIIKQFEAMHKYNNTVINLILFQQFQSYLKDEPFNESKAEKVALEFDAKLKRS